MALSMNRNKILGSASKIKKERKLKASSNGRFVLFVGDEGAILTYTHKTKVQRRLFAASPAPEHTEALVQLLSADRDAPIYLLLDSMDQSYQRQTLPPVAKMSLGKIIQRRLERDFSPEDLTSGLEIGREKGGRKDWNYLLVAVTTSGQIPAWLDILLARPNPFMGIYLSPVESEALVAKLASTVPSKPSAIAEGDGGKPKRAKKAKGTSYEWQLLVSHHKVGGFRLVVLHDGKLAFTRLAQPVGDTQPEIVAGNIEQEAINTIEYMKRMGYQDGMPLQILIITSADIKASISARNIPADAHHIFTPFEAAVALGLDDVAQEGDHYADILQSVHMLTLRTHRLVLHTVQSKLLRTLAQASLGVRALGCVLALALAGYGLWQASEAIGMGEQISRLEREQKTKMEEFNNAEAVMKQFPQDVGHMLDVLRLYRAYGKDIKYFASTAFAQLGEVPKNAYTIGEARWSRTITPGLYDGPATERIDFVFKGEVKKNYNDTLQSLKSRLNTLMSQIRAAFPDGDVSFSELPGIFTDTGELKTTIGGAGQDDAFQKMMTEPLKLDVTVVGPKKENNADAGAGSW
jgi:hypothetical protein